MRIRIVWTSLNYLGRKMVIQNSLNTDPDLWITSNHFLVVSLDNSEENSSEPNAIEATGKEWRKLETTNRPDPRDWVLGYLPSPRSV